MHKFQGVAPQTNDGRFFTPLFLVSYWHHLLPASDAATMISLELWRARIGSFNNKRCFRRSLSSLSSTSLASSSSNCRQNLSRDDLASSSIAQTSSSYSSLLVTVTPDEQLTTGHHLDHHAVSSSSNFLFSSTSNSSQDTFSSRTSSSSFWSSSSSFPCYQFFLHRSLLRDAVITLLIAIISQLLMIAGDIETNPGPKREGKNALTTCMFWLSIIIM